MASTTTSSAAATQLPLPWKANLFFSLFSFLAHVVIMVARPTGGPFRFLRRLCDTNLLFFNSSPISPSSLVDPDAVKGDGWAEAPKAVPSRPQLTWKTRLFVSLVSLLTDAVRRPDGTVRRYLSRFDLTVAPNPQPVRGVRTADVTVDPDRGLWFRLFLPDAAGSGGTSTKLSVVVFFHGGGFAFLSPSSLAYDAACRRICRNTGAAIVSVNYRLSPEHRCPAPYVDGLDVLRFLHWPCGGDQLLVRRFFEVADLSNCFVAGDSAGANIAHHVARLWSSSGGVSRLAGVIAIQPFFGGEERVESELRLAGAALVNTERTDWLWKAFLPHGSDRDHQACNPDSATAWLRRGHHDEEAHYFPPAMVVVGGFDPLQDWQRRYHQRLTELGKEASLVEFPTAIHGFYVLPELSASAEADLLMEEIRVFVHKHSSHGLRLILHGGGDSQP